MEDTKILVVFDNLPGNRFGSPRGLLEFRGTVLSKNEPIEEGLHRILTHYANDSGFMRNGILRGSPAGKRLEGDRFAKAVLDFLKKDNPELVDHHEKSFWRTYWLGRFFPANQTQGNFLETICTVMKKKGWYPLPF